MNKIDLIKIQGYLEKKTKTKEDWLQILYFYNQNYKLAGKTRNQFVKDTNLKLSTFEKVLQKYKNELSSFIDNNKPKKISRTQQLINDFRSGLKARQKDSGAANNNKQMKWFTNKVKQLNFKKVKMPEAGKLYLYAYDAKNKDTLPVWDKYPLILCLGSKVAKNGNVIFHGLNLHYVPPRVRQEFLEIMLVYSSTKRLSEKTKLNVDWSKVKSFPYAQKMIKAYLPSHMKQPASEILPNEWINIISMPLQQAMINNKKTQQSKLYQL